MPNEGPPDAPGAEHRTVAIATADAGPLDVHLLEAGSGPPVLMLHGWPQHAWCWHRVIPLMAERHRLICPDLRGFGWSDAPAGGYGPDTFAADAVALLDALEIERAHVVGHDWGGFTALVLALRHPERVERVLALSTPPPWPARSARALLAARRGWYAVPMSIAGGRVMRARPDRIAAAIRDGVEDGISASAALGYVERLGLPERSHVSKLLYRTYLRSAVGAARGGGYAGERLTRPARLMLGTRDPAIAPALLEGAERHADDLVVELVEGCGHFMPEERPELVAERALTLFGR